MITLLVVTLLTACRADNFFQDYIHRYLNHSIDPCDDFFGHVCSAAPAEEHYLRKMPHMMKERLSRYESDHCKEIVEIYQHAEQIKPRIFPDDEERKMEIRKICTETPDRCNKLLYYYNYREIENLTEEEKVMRIFYNSLPLEHFPTSRTAIMWAFANGSLLICKGEVLLREIDASENARLRMEAAEFRTDQLVNKLKKILIERFRDTKWLQNNAAVEKYQKLIENVVKSRFLNESYRPIAKNIHTIAKDCLSVMLGWSRHDVYNCLGMGYALALDKANINAFMPEIGFTQYLKAREVNAFYIGIPWGKDTVGATALVALASLERGITELATAGHIFGHELSHAVFRNALSFDSLPIENIDCIKRHREEVCDQSDFVCKMGNATIHEDAPDIMGLAAVLDLFEQEKDYIDGNPAGFSKEEYFFYTYTATWCTHELNHVRDSEGEYNGHSPKKGRINALLMHSETFQTAFSCKKGDRMWRNPDNFCHLLGPDASRR